MFIVYNYKTVCFMLFLYKIVISGLLIKKYICIKNSYISVSYNNQSMKISERSLFCYMARLVVLIITQIEWINYAKRKK